LNPSEFEKLLMQYEDPGEGGLVSVSAPEPRLSGIRRTRWVSAAVVDGPTHVLVGERDHADTFELVARAKLRVPNRYASSWSVFAYTEGIEEMDEVVIRTAFWDMARDVQRTSELGDSPPQLALDAKVRIVSHDETTGLGSLLKNLEQTVRSQNLTDSSDVGEPGFEFRESSLFVQGVWGTNDSTWNSTIIEPDWDGAVADLRAKIEQLIESPNAKPAQFCFGYYDTEYWWMKDALMAE
jgi:hypothetical protein